MAIPRIFISSTCYDFQEIRHQLRIFISDIGYEPVMSEFGDIFYDFDHHVQDACKNEIEKSDMFVLIIGNNYGSLYHKEVENSHQPDSVTLQEFRKALSIDIPMYIFINKFVQYDYDNYTRMLRQKTADHFSKNEVPNSEVEKTKQEVKKAFDKTYSFPNDAYKFVFYFLDILNNLEKNNALFPFESFSDIKAMLRKQWAGYVYESLNREKTVSIEVISDIDERLERIERKLRLLSESTKDERENGKIIIDINKLSGEFDLERLEASQEKIDNLLCLLMYSDPRYERTNRFSLAEKPTVIDILQFIETLPSLLEKYKWSKWISISELFPNLPFITYREDGDVPYKVCLELNAIVQNLTEEEKINFAETVIAHFLHLLPETNFITDPGDIPF